MKINSRLIQEASKKKMLSLQTKIENDHCHISVLKMIDSVLSNTSVPGECL